jgi:non-ribosomal peptide synthetase component F
MPSTSNEENDGSLVKLISNHASVRPDGLAAVWRDQVLTYGQLESQSLDLAIKLHSKGIRRGKKVVVITSRCVDMLVFFFAVLKVGACYVPIDPESSSNNRILHVVETVQPDLILAKMLDIQLPYQKLLWPTTFDDFSASIIQQSKTKFTPKFDCHRPEDLIYIIFTSGTTSKPKGVKIPHRALLHYVGEGDPTRPFNLGTTPMDRVLLIFSPAFDGISSHSNSFHSNINTDSL